jgi:Ser-tRNA(Ala) deacylase AlaX
MALTKKLYYIDPYMKEFTATVVKIIDKNKIILDQTCFYPRGGGQVGDTGYINDIRVVDTFYENGEIVHLLEKEPNFKEGDKVIGRIDWERRYRIMRLHSASHIMEYFLFKVCGEVERVGSNVDDRRDCSTYAYDRLDPEKVKEVERLVNEFISKNLPIETWSDPNNPDFRWWKCGKIITPCGGTHPKNTAEIDSVILKRRRKGRRKEQILTYLAEDYQEK